MKIKKLLLPATLAIGYASFSQSEPRKTSPAKTSNRAMAQFAIATSSFDLSDNRKVNYLPGKKISINMDDATLNKIIRELRQLTHLQFLAHPNALNFARKINIHLNNVTIEQILTYIERAFAVRCVLQDETIIIKLKTFVYNRISCQVVDSAGHPVPNAFVIVKGFDRPHYCNQMGAAFLDNITGIDTLIIYAEGYKERSIAVESEKMRIVMKKKPGTLPTHHVTYKNGIKEESAATAKGSYLKTNMASYQNRNPDPNIIRRLQAISIPFLINNGNINGSTAGSSRGINTFQGNRSALTVVNGHAQMVNSDYINPFDVQSIYQIRDAEAASLWGVASSNGVYNFELKKGVTSGCDVNFSISRTVTQKPNLFYRHGLSAASHIFLERQAFESNMPIAWSPVYESLSKGRTPAERDAITKSMLQKWGQNNLKQDLLNTAYQRGVLQQIGLSVQTGTAKMQHYLSIGIDDNKAVEKGNRFQRVTALANTTFQSGDWEAQATANIAHIKTEQNFVKLTTDLPYLSLYNEDGSPAPLPRGGRPLDSTFLDPDFVYQTEAKLADHTIQQLYKSFTFKLSHQSHFGLKSSIDYQFSHTGYTDRNQHLQGSYFTRTLLNDFRQNANGNITWPIPIGDITDRVTMEAYIHSLRGQLDYQKRIGDLRVSLLLGTELRSYDMSGNANRIYASNMSLYPTPIDYATLFPTLSGAKLRIPYKNSLLDSADNLIGHYESGTLTYQDKYSISVSTRTDYMNRFSPAQNKRGLGLWSAGASWYVSREDFYSIQHIFPDLKLRFTLGQNGNVDYSIPPFHSIQSTVNQGLVYNYAIASTQKISWEKLFMFNAGIDFSTRIIKGSVDLYKKKNNHLLQYQAWNPTAGTAQAISNSGSLAGGGIDLNLQTEQLVILDDFNYSSTLLLAHTTNRVTSDNGIKKPAQDYTNNGLYIPRKGYPAEAIFAFPYGGLNGKGEPMGYLNGLPSQAYDSIITETDGSTLRYIGSASPTVVANMTHSFHYKSFTLSCLLIFKGGYYVRKAALNYYKLLQHSGGNAPGFESRWQEDKDVPTDIPGLLFPINPSSLQFYESSTAHTIKGDHLRLQDVQLSYQLDNSKHKRFPFKKMEAIASVNNVGIIWRANKHGIDPEVPAGWHPQPQSFTFSLKFTY